MDTEKYYKIEVQTLMDGSTAITPTATYTSMNEAEISYHQACAYVMSSDNIRDALIQIIGKTGETIFTKFYTNPDAPEPNQD